MGEWEAASRGRGYIYAYISDLGFPGSPVGKESTCNAGDVGSIPVSTRSPRGGHGNPLQCSCLENSMDRVAWQAHRAAKSQDTTERLTQLLNLSSILLKRVQV